MKLLRMRMMIKPYICLIGGNLLNGGRTAAGGGGVFSQQQQLVRPPPSSSSSSSSKHKHKTNKHKHIKVIKPDGMVTIFNRRIKACEVMNEYPKHMVCRSDSLYIGQIIPHLSQQDKLEKGHTYFLLPSHIFHSVLSFVTIASSFASPPPPPPSQKKSSSSSSSDVDDEKQQQQQPNSAAALNVKKKKAAASSNLLKRCSSSSPAFDIQKTTSGTLRIRVSEVFISQLIMEQQQEEEEEEEDNILDEYDDKHQLLCTTPQLHKDYKQLVMGSRVRHWKPKLEMISEHKKRKTLLSSASFSINNKTKRKSNHRQTITTTSAKPLPVQTQIPPQSSLPATTMPNANPRTCKLRRFKLKLRGLTTTTTTTTSPSCRNPPKSRKQH